MPQSPKALQFTAPTVDPAFPSPARIIPARSPVSQSLSSDGQGAGRMRAAACPEGGQEPWPCRTARSGAEPRSHPARPLRAAERFRRCLRRIDHQVKLPPWHRPQPHRPRPPPAPDPGPGRRPGEGCGAPRGPRPFSAPVASARSRRGGAGGGVSISVPLPGPGPGRSPARRGAARLHVCAAAVGRLRLSRACGGAGRARLLQPAPARRGAGEAAAAPCGSERRGCPRPEPGPGGGRRRGGWAQLPPPRRAEPRAPRSPLCPAAAPAAAAAPPERARRGAARSRMALPPAAPR